MQRRLPAATTLAVLLSFPACTPSDETPPEAPLYTHTTATPQDTTIPREPPKRPQIRLPASFVTVSADPPRETVTLRPDGAFLSKKAHRNGEKEFDIGRWRFSDDGERLLLSGGTQDTRQYALADRETLIPLDEDGRPHESARERQLARSDLYDPIRDSMRLVGMAVYLADAASFTECRSRLQFPVAMERGYSEFERTYLDHQSAPGAPLLVSLYGHLEERPAADRQGTEEVLVVERFESAWPGQPCPQGAVFQASLRTTYWRLLDVQGRPALAPPGGREPHLILEQKGGRARGSLGCRDFTTSFEQEESLLRFAGLALSPRQCDEGGDMEFAFEQALESCTSYRIEGEMLYLYGEEEATARFAAASPN